jgi:sec-independent protein translocase protein TatC
MIMITTLFVIFYFFADSIYNFLVQPYADAVEGEEGRRLIFTALHETFFTYIKVALFASLFISLPFLLIQLWIFVAPGLYKNEKSVVVPYLLATPILFILGSALVYYLIMPLAIKFFLSFESIGGNGALPIQLEAKVNEYLSLIMRLILAFGLCFQLPVALTLMARVGFVSSESLRKNRKYVIVGVFAVAAILTPPDPISQIGLGIPILLLYELSIIAVSFIEKGKNN